MRLDDRALQAAILEFNKQAVGSDEPIALPTASTLALIRKAAERTLALRPFDEQLIACCGLLTGHGVEMDTGEGKTLVGALATALHVLSGRRVHVISVNDYLAERDANWMRPLFDFLGVDSGWIGQRTAFEERQRIYAYPIVYAPVSEIGFDVLRDRFAVDAREAVHPVFDVAVVDEADAVMIDEAMIPLVLAGSADHQADEFSRATELIEDLRQGHDFSIDDDQATVTLTDAGLDSIEARLGGINLYDSEHIELLTRINLALHAELLLHRDVDYLVIDGAIKLINTTRGRIAHLQRWPDGLQAAVEAKEQLVISAAGEILDMITIQDLLLRYTIRSGMSGTLLSVAEELMEFYQLPVGRVERHKPNIRTDNADSVFLTGAEKTEALVHEVVTRHGRGQPVLVGTQSVAESEELDLLLREAGIEARVLNAKNDAEEARIVARAGEYAAVTISTQMSGRGTDIRLGGADEHGKDRVIALGGLAVLATSRYPSRRLDAQLRGRSGRQGDPGVSHTFISFEDDLVQLHATQRMFTKTSRRQETLTAAERQDIIVACQTFSEGIRNDRH